MSAVVPLARPRRDEVVIGRRAAVALLVILLAALTGTGVVLAHEISQREQDTVHAHLGVALSVALNEVSRLAAQAQRQASTLAGNADVQRALARSDAPALRRLTAGVPGATATPAGARKPVASALLLRRDVTVLGGGKVIGSISVPLALDADLLAQLQQVAPLQSGEFLLLVEGRTIVAAPAGFAARPSIAASATTVRTGSASFAAAQAEAVGASVRLVALAPRAEIDGPVSRSVHRLILSLVATLATLLLLGRILARPVLRPVRALAREAARSGTDHLTQLPNRRAFVEAATRELAQAVRAREPVAVAIVDVDDFKSVNDAFGHAAGDEVLCGVANLLRDEIREGDLGARYGGEEFAILLPATDLAGAREVCERFRAALAASRLAAGPTHPEGITVSIGIAAGVDDTLDDLLAAADDALYASKRAGKDATTAAGATRAR